MKRKDYVPSAMRTLSPIEQKVLTQTEWNALHACIGMCTEAGELVNAIRSRTNFVNLDLVNVEEEIGDFFWYLALHEYCYPEMDHSMPITVADDMSVMDKVHITNSIHGLTISTSELMDAWKKSLFYGREIDMEVVRKNIRDICHNLSRLMAFIRANEYSIRVKNIAKLRARYPEKFNTERADNRDLKKEREILEGDTHSHDFFVTRGGLTRKCKLCGYEEDLVDETDN